MEKISATWSIGLNVYCPHCSSYVDLMDSNDDWEGMPQAGETKLNHDREHTCPECRKEFTVNSIEY